jgi:hypothetical protein
MAEPNRYEVTGFHSDALDGLLGTIRATYVNGGALFAQVRAVDVDDPARWFAIARSRHRYRWHGTSFERARDAFGTLFDSQAMRTAVPELRIPDPYPTTEPPQFLELPKGTRALVEDLASALLHGGAYRHFPGPAADALEVVSTGLADLMGRRRQHFRVFQSHAPWTPWFFDVAWDHTWILADYQRLEASVLCMTDTD